MIQRHPDLPIPNGNSDPRHIGDGAYISHDGFQLWLSCDREHGLEAVSIGAMREGPNAIMDYWKWLKEKYSVPGPV